MVVPICNPSYLGGWEDHEFKASLGCTAISYFQNKQRPLKPFHFLQLSAVLGDPGHLTCQPLLS